MNCIYVSEIKWRCGNEWITLTSPMCLTIIITLLNIDNDNDNGCDKYRLHKTRNIKLPRCSCLTKLNVVFEIDNWKPRRLLCGIKPTVNTSGRMLDTWVGKQLNTFRYKQNGHHLEDEIFNFIFVAEYCCFYSKIPLKLVPKDGFNNKSALV